MTGTPVGHRAERAAETGRDHRVAIAAGRQMEGVLQAAGQESEVPEARRHRGAHRRDRRRRHRPRALSAPPCRYRVSAAGSSVDFAKCPSSSSARARPVSPPRRCWHSTASTAWYWTDGRASTRSRARCISTTRSSGSSRASVSPTSSPRSPGPPAACGSLTRRCGCWPSSIATPRAVCNGFPQANMFDQPELESLLRTNLKRYPSAELRGNVEVTDIAETSGGRYRVTFVDRTDGPSTPSTPTTCWGATAPTASCAARIGATMRDLKLRAALARRRCGHRCRSRPVGRCAPGVRSRPGRHVHAHRADSLPLGVSAPARRNRRRLPQPRRAEAADRPVDVWRRPTMISN